MMMGSSLEKEHKHSVLKENLKINRDFRVLDQERMRVCRRSKVTMQLSSVKRRDRD
jgi:hypothetical protein